MAAAGDDIITHRNVEVNGVRLHVAEAGPAGAPVALLLHGFPELWYTWRHQMPALAAAGYRAVAPDLRGYGDSDAPAGGPSKYTALHVVGDLVALVDSLGQEQVRARAPLILARDMHASDFCACTDHAYERVDSQVFVVAHDWGALIAWYMCLFRPDKVKALVAMSVAFIPRDPAQTLVEAYRSLYGDEYYVCRFQVQA